MVRSVFGGRMSHATVRWIDLGLVIWLILCIALGVAVTKRLNRLGALGDGVISAGTSITDVADALDNFASTPLIGGTLASIADKVNGLGTDTIDRGKQSKTAIWRAALTVGLMLALLPSVPLILLWVVIRVGWERERGSVRADLESGAPGVREYLAHRTVDLLSYRELRAITEHPWDDLRAGRFDVLANVELARLGLERFATTVSPPGAPAAEA